MEAIIASGTRFYPVNQKKKGVLRVISPADMGFKSLPPHHLWWKYRLVLKEEIRRWNRFPIALRKDDKEAFKEIAYSDKWPRFT